MTIDDYFEGRDADARTAFERVERIVKEVTPEAEATFSYGMPTFKVRGRPVLYFGVFKRHMSLFPGAPLAVSSEQLAGLKHSKGTIQFTADTPVPEEVIKAIVKSRLPE